MIEEGQLYMVIFMVIVCVAVFLMLYWQFVKRRAVLAIEDMMGVEDDKSVPKLEQIRVLEASGIHFTDEEKKQKFILGCTYESNDYLAHHPYYGILLWAGSDEILDCVWAFGDREGVYGDKFYGEFLKQLKRISGLSIENIRGFERYSVAFSLDGKEYVWSGKRNRDWLDTGLAAYLNSIAGSEGEGFYLDDTHEGPIYLWASREKAHAININTRLRFSRALLYPGRQP